MNFQPPPYAITIAVVLAQAIGALLLALTVAIFLMAFLDDRAPLSSHIVLNRAPQLFLWSIIAGIIAKLSGAMQRLWWMALVTIIPITIWMIQALPALRAIG